MATRDKQRTPLFSGHRLEPGAIVRFRDSFDLTQDDLARLLGVKSITISRWERGEQTPPDYLRLALLQLEHQLATVESRPQNRRIRWNE